MGQRRVPWSREKFRILHECLRTTVTATACAGQVHSQSQLRAQRSPSALRSTENVKNVSGLRPLEIGFRIGFVALSRARHVTGREGVAKPRLDAFWLSFCWFGD